MSLDHYMDQVLSQLWLNNLKYLTILDRMVVVGVVVVVLLLVFVEYYESVVMSIQRG